MIKRLFLTIPFQTSQVCSLKFTQNQPNRGQSSQSPPRSILSIPLDNHLSLWYLEGGGEGMSKNKNGTKNGTKARNLSTKKVLVVCQKCQKEFVAETTTKPPKYCENCRKNTTWKVIGYEDTKYGKVRVEERNGKVRKILVE